MNRVVHPNRLLVSSLDNFRIGKRPFVVESFTGPLFFYCLFSRLPLLLIPCSLVRVSVDVVVAWIAFADEWTIITTTVIFSSSIASKRRRRRRRRRKVIHFPPPRHQHSSRTPQHHWAMPSVVHTHSFKVGQALRHVWKTQWLTSDRFVYCCGGAFQSPSLLFFLLIIFLTTKK